MTVSNLAFEQIVLPAPAPLFPVPGTTSVPPRRSVLAPGATPLFGTAPFAVPGF